MPVSVFYSLSHLSDLSGECQEKETFFRKFETKLGMLEDEILDVNIWLCIVNMQTLKSL